MRRNGFKAGKIHQLLCNAWQERAPSESTVYLLFGEFAAGSRVSFEDKERCGRPKTAITPENVAATDQLIQEDNRITLREMVTQLGICHGTLYTIISVHLQLTSLCSRWVPHALTAPQKQHRVDVAHAWLDLFQEYEPTDLCSRIVTIDEKYFYHRTLGRKCSNRAWCIEDNERPEIPRRVMHDRKSHVICASGFNGRFYFEVVENGESINSERFISFLKNMQKKFVHERNNLGWSRMILIVDNARPHVSKMTKDFCVSKEVIVLNQPPYSPDYNLCDRWLFSELEKLRRNTNFASVADLKEFLQEALSGLDKDTVRRQLQHLSNDLKAVIDAGGRYL